jgi:hypothetical protein
MTGHSLSARLSLVILLAQKKTEREVSIRLLALRVKRKTSTKLELNRAMRSVLQGHIYTLILLKIETLLIMLR